MATLTLRVVRPDRLIVEDEATSVVLMAKDGEVGIFPLHDPLIMALGTGVMRYTRESDGEVVRIACMGGYAEILADTVIVLADHARMLDDIERDIVEQTREEALANIKELGSDEHRQAYYEEKIRWCDLLLEHAPNEDAA